MPYHMRRLLYVMSIVITLTTPATAQIVDLTEHAPFKSTFLVKAASQMTRVAVHLPVGEADLTGPEGLAHYLEHLVWFYADRVYDAGLKERISNAWTNPFWTTYWNQSDQKELSSMLQMVGRVFESVELAPSFMREERGIVEQEFDFSQRENPFRQIFTRSVRRLYADHGFGSSVIGTPATLARISPEDALAFHQARYRMQDVVLLVFGPVPETELRSLMSEIYAD